MCTIKMRKKRKMRKTSEDMNEIMDVSKTNEEKDEIKVELKRRDASLENESSRITLGKPKKNKKEGKSIPSEETGEPAIKAKKKKAKKETFLELSNQVAHNEPSEEKPTLKKQKKKQLRIKELNDETGDKRNSDDLPEAEPTSSFKKERRSKREKKIQEEAKNVEKINRIEETISNTSSVRKSKKTEQGTDDIIMEKGEIVVIKSSPTTKKSKRQKKITEDQLKNIEIFELETVSNEKSKNKIILFKSSSVKKVKKMKNKTEEIIDVAPEVKIMKKKKKVKNENSTNADVNLHSESSGDEITVKRPKSRKVLDSSDESNVEDVVDNSQDKEDGKVRKFYIY